MPDLFDLAGFDITAKRHGGAETSVAANAAIAPHKAASREAVLAIIRRRGEATLDDIALEMGRQKNAVSGRVSELLAAERIEVAGKAKNAAGMTVRIYRTRGTE